MQVRWYVRNRGGRQHRYRYGTAGTPSPRHGAFGSCSAANPCLLTCTGAVILVVDAGAVLAAATVARQTTLSDRGSAWASAVAVAIAGPRFSGVFLRSWRAGLAGRRAASAGAVVCSLHCKGGAVCRQWRAALCRAATSSDRTLRAGGWGMGAALSLAAPLLVLTDQRRSLCGRAWSGGSREA